MAEKETKENQYEAGFSSDAKKEPVRVVFITKKTSAKVIGDAGPRLMTYPHLLIREAITFMVLVIALVGVALVLGRSARAACEPAPHAQSCQGSVVFPGFAGAAALFPAAGGGDHHSHTRCNCARSCAVLQR